MVLLTHDCPDALRAMVPAEAPALVAAVCRARDFQAAQLLRRTGGFPSHEHFGSCALAAAQMARLPGEIVDEEVSRIGESLVLGAGAGAHIASATIRAVNADASRKKTRASTNRLAAVTTIMSLHRRRMVEAHLAAALPQSALLSYIEFCAYDETPFQVAIKDTDKTGIMASARPMALPAIGDVEPTAVVTLAQALGFSQKLAVAVTFGK